jgi:site-specific DNA-methyltransferase (adenine-specific)
MKEIVINNCNLKLYNNDCFKILATIPDESIDLVVSDPPYAIQMKNAHVIKESEWDKFTSQEYIDFMTKWLKECYRVLTPNGTCWFFYGFTRIKEILAAIESTPFINHLENHLVYARSKGRASKNRLKSLREECAMLTKTKSYTWNFEEYLRKVVAPYREKGGAHRGWDYGKDGVTPVRATGLGNVVPIFTAFEEVEQTARRGIVLDIGTGQRLPLSGDIYNLQFPIVPSVNNKLEKQIHSAQKSILLLSMLILLSSKEGDTILDSFGGSFSCGVASAICGRNFIGIEKEKETFDKGVNFIKNIKYDRWEDYIKSHITTTETDSKFKFGPRQFYANQLSHS